MIIGLSKKGLDIFCWTLFIVLSSAYLFVANAEYHVRVLDLKNKNTNETTRILHVQGDYDEGITDAARKALDKYDVDRAVLFSPGGQGIEGYDMARLFSDKKTNTYVAKGTYCLSACAIAFVGGDNYEVNDGILGFHKAYIPGDVYKDQQEAFKHGSSSGRYNLFFFLANGFSAEFSFVMDSKTDPDNFVVFTNEDDLNKHYVRTKENNLDDYLQPLNSKFTVWGGDEMISYLKDNPNEDTGWEIKEELFHSTNKKDNDDE